MRITKANRSEICDVFFPVIYILVHSKYVYVSRVLIKMIHLLKVGKINVSFTVIDQFLHQHVERAGLFGSVRV